MSDATIVLGDPRPVVHRITPHRPEKRNPRSSGTESGDADDRPDADR